MQTIFSNLGRRITRFRNVPLSERRQQLRHWSRRPRAVPVLTIAGLVLFSLMVFVVARQTHHLPPAKNAKIVIISHDHQQQIVPSDEPTVGSLLQKLHLKLQPGDVVEPAAATEIDQDQFRVNIYRAVPVTVNDGGRLAYTQTAARTGRSISQQAGVSVYPEDIASVTPTENFVKTASIGSQVTIDRATPVNVDLYGTKVVLRTHAKTVGGLMHEKHIVLNKSDRLVPAQNTPIAANQQISFIRTGVKVETVTENIAMPIQTINDSSLAYGTNAVRQQGSPGQQIVTYQVSLVNNVETGRNIMQKVITKQPVTQVVVVGSSLSGIKGDMALAGIAPGDYQYADYIISRESGWCPTKAQGQYGGCPPYSGSVPSYGGYGLCQSTPGSKMASAGGDWATNPITQLRWCSGYAHAHYGSWAAAYSHWLNSHSW